MEPIPPALRLFSGNPLAHFERAGPFCSEGIGTTVAKGGTENRSGHRDLPRWSKARLSAGRAIEHEVGRAACRGCLITGCQDVLDPAPVDFNDPQQRSAIVGSVLRTTATRTVSRLGHRRIRAIGPVHRQPALAGLSRSESVSANSGGREPPGPSGTRLHKQSQQPPTPLPNCKVVRSIYAALAHMELDGCFGVDRAFCTGLPPVTYASSESVAASSR